MPDLKCVLKWCNGNLKKLSDSKKSNYEINYYRCIKCGDLSYNTYVGDTYDREVFTSEDYQRFLTRLDDLIATREKRERELNQREKALEQKQQELQSRGLRGLIRRLLGFKNAQEKAS